MPYEIQQNHDYAVKLRRELEKKCEKQGCFFSSGSVGAFEPRGGFATLRGEWPFSGLPHRCLLCRKQGVSGLEKA